MAKLEILVPSLELCKLIPKGSFVDSPLVWGYELYDGIYTDPERPREPSVIAIQHCAAWEQHAPAPTLEEVLEEIGTIEPWDTATITRMIGDKTKLVDFTLKRWFQLNNIEVKS